MKKADALLSLAAGCALLLGACSQDEQANDSGLIAPAGNGDAGTVQGSSPVNASQDAGASIPPPAPMDAALPTMAQMDSGPMGVVPAMPDAGPADASLADASLAHADAASDSGEAGSGDSEFDTCMAQVKPLCIAKEMNTAALMEQACKAVQAIPIPLTDGGVHGPKTLSAGPYAARIDWNEGAGTTFVNEVNIGEEICVPFGIDTFMEPTSVNDELKNLRGVDWSLYTIFRPACMKKGEKYPVITWANGTCGEIAGYSTMLSAVASYGYVIVAANSTWTATWPTDTVQLRALDYAKSLNENPMSPLYQRLDLDHIGAMGHSQGAGATSAADDDPRVKASIYWNSGTSNEKPFLNVSGERDIGNTITAASMATETNAATQPGGFIFFKKVLQTGGMSTGHLTLMEEPERVIDLTVAWWDWQLKSNQEAKKMFVGESCGLCTKKDELDYGSNMLLK